MKPRILLVCNENAHFSEFRKLMESSLRDRFDFLVLFDRDTYDASTLFAKEIELTRKSGFPTLSLPATYSSSPIALRLYRLSDRICQSRMFQRFKLDVLTAGFVSRVAKFFDARKRWRAKLDAVSAFLRDHKIRVVVMGEENFLLRTYLYTRPAKGRVPIIVYPYTVPNPKEMALGACFSCPANSWSGFFLRLIGGRWVKIFDGKVYLLLNLLEVLMLLPYWPKRPWTLNNGDHDFLCVESPHMLELYLRLGFNKDELRLTGSVNDDELLKNDVSINTERPRILIALPPDQFDAPRAEFENYPQFLTALKQAIEPWLQRYDFIFAKHPRLKSDYDHLLEGFHLSPYKVIDLLPGAALYIASVSATIRWAIACGIPCINYDIWRYEYGDFESAHGVVNTFSIGETEEALSRLLKDNGAELENLKGRQMSCAKDWGFTDGRSVERLSSVFEEALSRGDRA